MRETSHEFSFCEMAMSITEEDMSEESSESLGDLALELLRQDCRPSVMLEVGGYPAGLQGRLNLACDAVASELFRKAIRFQNDAFRNTIGRPQYLAELSRMTLSEKCSRKFIIRGWQCTSYTLGKFHRIRVLVAEANLNGGEATHMNDRLEWTNCAIPEGGEIDWEGGAKNIRIQDSRSPTNNNGISSREENAFRPRKGRTAYHVAYPENFLNYLDTETLLPPTPPALDWTRDDFVPLPQYNDQHYEDLRHVDWSKTSLGNPSTWDTVLRTHATSIMTNAYPTALYWGPDYTMIYNEHWITIAQNRNPQILGKTFVEGWPELSQFFYPILDKAYYRGEATTKGINAKMNLLKSSPSIVRKCTHKKTSSEAECLFVTGRSVEVDFEETYFNFIICPIVGEHGTPVGVIEQAFEITRDHIFNRRISFLRNLEGCLAQVGDLHKGEFMQNVVDVFVENETIHNDSPFLTVYKVANPPYECHLVDTIGVPKGGYVAPEKCKLKSRDDCSYFAKEMERAMETGRFVLKRLDPEMMKAVEYRGFHEPCKYAAIIPIQPTRSLTQAFLIMGINPRRPFDDDYKFWIELLMTELASTSGRARLLLQEIRRGVEAQVREAERKQAIETKKLLDQRTEELKDSELFFTKVAENLPVGLALMDPNGIVVFTNDAYHELTVISRPVVGVSSVDWSAIAYKEDNDRVVGTFEAAIASRSSVQFECRCGDNHGDRGWKYWVACNLIIDVSHKNGDFKGYILTVVDITSLKLAEEYQKEQSLRALERRRQQENFIDIFSHELRNPFSATLQCADGIVSSVMDFQLHDGTLDAEDIIDAASTILVCVQHQMRIIDDVLTLSKLDSMLLSVVPVDVQIHESVVRTFKIFQSELQVKGIKACLEIGEMYDFLKVDWLKCDPSRFNQILVNLLTNAIKFTSLQRGKREISVRLDASPDRPCRIGKIVFDHSQEEIDSDKNMVSGEWGSGEPVYILVTVRDTGIGISEKWQAKLFHKFEQVPKTHVTYGGSGLGLFICRKLCRIQGGEIGVYSEEGKGSTFAFYIRTKRVERPRLDLEGIQEQRGAETELNSKNAQPIGETHDVRPKSTRGGSFPLSAVEPAEDSPPADVSVSAGVRPPFGIRTTSEQFIPHSTICASQATLSQFKTQRSPSIQQMARRTTVKLSYRILIVEDNVINQEVLRRQLRNEGCVAYVANNGKEALDFICKSSFAVEGSTEVDIVLMDMEMPVMDGNTATRRIRELERKGQLKRHVPIMGISANARSEQVSEMTKAGMDDAISKPFRIVDLLERFNKLIEGLEKIDKVKREAMETHKGIEETIRGIKQPLGAPGYSMPNILELSGKGFSETGSSRALKPRG